MINLSETSIADWIASGSALVSALAVVCALIYAHRQISVWRVEAKSRRRAEIAEDVLTNAYEISDLFRAIRWPVSNIPEQEIKNKAYQYERRLRQIDDGKEIFQSLRYAQTRAKFVLQNDRVDEAISGIFKLRVELVYALDNMIDSITSWSELDIEEKEKIREYKKTIFGRTDKTDQFESQLNKQISALDKILGPMIRYEVRGN